MSEISGDRAVIVSSLVSVGDVAFSFIVAAITGSSVMLAQGLQGMADSITTIFLFIGLRRSRRKADEDYPLGYGRELFFWVLIASVFAFLFSGGLASYRAVQQIIDGSVIDSVYIALGALAFGFMTNGYSFLTSFRRLAQQAGDQSYIEYLRYSSLVETKMTLLVDFLGTLSALFGLIALGMFVITDNPLFDGVGALLIGILTAAGAMIVIIDLRDLIVGRRPNPRVIKDICDTALTVRGVQEVLDIRAISVGSGEVLAILEVHFKDGHSTDEIEQITDRVKAKVIDRVQQVTRVQVEAETPDEELRRRKKTKR